jgi:very-short-patch-repair endonuclease
MQTVDVTTLLADFGLRHTRVVSELAGADAKCCPVRETRDASRLFLLAANAALMHSGWAPS